MGGVKVPQAPRGVGCERGYISLPTGVRVWGRGWVPSPENFRIFVENTIF